MIAKNAQAASDPISQSRMDAGLLQQTFMCIKRFQEPVAGLRGLEPRTLGLEVRCSIH